MDQAKSKRKKKEYPLRKWAYLVYVAGWPLKKVAREHGRGLSYVWIYRCLIKNGYPEINKWHKETGTLSRTHQLDDAQLEFIYRRKQEGATWWELARPHDMTEFQVAGILRHHSIKRGWEWPIKVAR
ncbi:MAG: hypothetical protein OXC41_01830 [Gammaproteobacteria bacterium]|nr:hypothetical protein [Gammaproteobacteria bacterium]